MKSVSNPQRTWARAHLNHDRLEEEGLLKKIYSDLERSEYDMKENIRTNISRQPERPYASNLTFDSIKVSAELEQGSNQ